MKFRFKVLTQTRSRMENFENVHYSLIQKEITQQKTFPTLRSKCFIEDNMFKNLKKSHKTEYAHR